MAAFTHYWTYKDNKDEDGQQMDSVSSDDFKRRGMEAGDVVFVVMVRNGRLHLVGRLPVDAIISTEQIKQIKGDDYPFAYRSEHCVGRGSRVSFDRVVPDEVTRQ